MRLSEFAISQVITAGINDPFIFKAMFTAGGGGSGKSFVAEQMFAGTGLKVLNSDVAFEFLLKRQNLSFKIDPSKPEVFQQQMKARDKAKHLAAMQHNVWTNGMLGMVVDGTGRNYGKISGAREGLAAMGYDTGMLYVNTALDVALERNKMRPRQVPENELVKAWNEGQANIGKFQNLFGGSNFFVIDNSGTLTREEVDRVGTALRRKALGWLKQPLRNPVGIAIVSKLKRTGGKTLADLETAYEKAATAYPAWVDYHYDQFMSSVNEVRV